MSDSLKLNEVVLIAWKIMQRPVYANHDIPV